MGINSFWLFYIETDSVLVALINWGNGRFYVASIGPRVPFDASNHKSLVTAVDESLSSAAISADISPEQEPIFVGLVIPSAWVGEDGKIVKPKSEMIVPLLKELDLKASGFISSDEAIIEEANKPDDFPASFINIYLESSVFELSLIYLGKVKKRIRKFFDGEFNPQFVEDALVELNLESTLPPQIYLYGQVDDSTIESLKNFPWVGKKNVETFLHFPDIKLYNDQDLVNIFFKAITSQMIGGGNPAHESLPQVETESVETLEEIQEDQDFPSDDETVKVVESTETEEKEEADNEPECVPLTEVSFTNLGFSKEQLTPFPSPSSSPPLASSPQNIIETSPSQSEKKSFSFKLPHLKLPQFKSNFLILLLPLAVILASLPLFLSKARLILFATPLEFSKTVKVTLDSEAQALSTSIIPVNQNSITVNSSVSIPATGQKTVGNKATGEVTIFNKVEKVQNIPKGSILTDPKGQNFELISDIQVAASNTDFQLGTMVFGQVKTVISAIDIGPEYNISKDTPLKFKDFPENSIIIKVNEDFSGGTKEQISAVSQQDKSNAEEQLADKLKSEATATINQEFNSTNDVIKETIQTKKSKTDLNREVGEEADNLTASAQATVSVFVLKPELKEAILNQFLADQENFSQSIIDPKNFNFSFKIDKLDPKKATGSLVITGNSLPKIDTESIKKSIAGKTYKKAEIILKDPNSRTYNFNLKISWNLFNLLPFDPKNILVDIKTESL